jgi:hypothetical protein
MSEATVLNKRGKAGEFVWDQKDNQTFTGPGQTVTQPPQTFNKWAGHYFSMEAPGQTLTLQVTDGSYNFWSMAGQEFPPPTASTDIGIKKGNFVFKSNGTLQFGYEIPSTPTRLTVENDAQFTIAGTLKLIALQAVTVDAKNSGLVDINCGQIDFSEAGEGARSIKIFVQDKARMSATASSALKLSDTAFTVSSVPDSAPGSEYALKLAGPTQLAKVTMNLIDNSRSLLQGDVLDLDGATTIAAKNDAACNFIFDDIYPAPGARFTLDHRGQMNFGGDFPFQFPDRSYTAGTFAFTGSSVVNSAAFVFQVEDFDEAKAAILGQQLVSVNGQNQHDEKLLSFTGGGNSLTIKRK